MTPRPRFPFRQQAEEHVSTAKRLLAAGAPELRYACLELRLAIEALAYDTLQNYAEDISPDVEAAYQHWQPGKVLKQLRAYDPIADQPLKIEMRLVATGRLGSEAHTLSAVDDRFTAGWAAKAHTSMGSFLHQRTISHVRNGKPIDERVLLREARRVITRLENILASEVHDLRTEIRFGYPCPACSADISVGIGPLMIGKAQTDCASGGAKWTVEGSDVSGVPLFSRVPAGRSGAP
jgi:hypothetical protein